MKIKVLEDGFSVFYLKSSCPTGKKNNKIEHIKISIKLLLYFDSIIIKELKFPLKIFQFSRTVFVVLRTIIDRAM